jgi:ribose transport system permease protein
MTDIASTASGAATSEPRRPRLSGPWYRRLPFGGRNSGLLLALILAIAFITVQHPHYFSWSNFLVVGLQMSYVMICAVGMSVLIIGGSVDLSVGSIFGVAAVVAALLAKHIPPGFAIVVAIALAGLFGLINGALVWRVKLSPLIITLGTLTALAGVQNVLTKGFAITSVPASFSDFGNTAPLGLPMGLFLAVIIVPVGYIVLHYTTIGRHTFAIGANRDASQAAGLKLRRLVLGAFVVNGLLAGLAGTVAASRYGSADPTFGVNFELDVITAVVLGGVAFTGGEGGLGGVVLAVALLGVIDSGLVWLNISPFWGDVVSGTVLVIAVSLDQLSSEFRDRRQRRVAMRERRREAEGDGAVA